MALITRCLPFRFTVDVWDLMRLSETTVYVEFSNVTDVIEAVRNGTADVGMGAVSITKSREEVIDFSLRHAVYFESGLHLLARADRGPSAALWAWAASGMTWRNVLIALFVVEILFALALILWAIESATGPTDGTPTFFSSNPIRGVLQAFQWIVVSCIQRNRYAPRRCVTRSLSIGLTLASMLVFASVTAYLTTVVLSIVRSTTVTSLADLRGRRIGTVMQSTSERFLDLEAVQAQVYRYYTVQDMVAGYNDGQVDALLYDLPILQHHYLLGPLDCQSVVVHPALAALSCTLDWAARRCHILTANLCSSVLGSDGFLFREKDDPGQYQFRERVNRAVLSARELLAYRRLVDAYFTRPGQAGVARCDRSRPSFHGDTLLLAVSLALPIVIATLWICYRQRCHALTRERRPAPVGDDDDDLLLLLRQQRRRQKPGDDDRVQAAPVVDFEVMRAIWSLATLVHLECNKERSSTYEAVSDNEHRALIDRQRSRLLAYCLHQHDRA
ncbi:Solute-binding protein family 3/N-terminal domain-containing protein [Plasmodiophora brassicae]|uniref:Solute-binding protein family 3/N-terminal domain-containing protein n=1 Tax=Plasmodiophora brassicae TaxID=37360 RepID=A0A0G4IZV3_PLABS|nr:hypothetical protein PBRA_008167 [Plasmodiophora brassicae]